MDVFIKLGYFISGQPCIYIEDSFWANTDIKVMKIKIIDFSPLSFDQLW